METTSVLWDYLRLNRLSTQDKSSRVVSSINRLTPEFNSVIRALGLFDKGRAALSSLLVSDHRSLCSSATNNQRGLMRSSDLDCSYCSVTKSHFPQSRQLLMLLLFLWIKIIIFLSNCMGSALDKPARIEVFVGPSTFMVTLQHGGLGSSKQTLYSGMLFITREIDLLPL